MNSSSAITSDRPNSTPAADPAPTTGLPDLCDVQTPEGMRAAIDSLGDSPEACLLCEAPAPRALFERDGKRYWSCSQCELVFVHDLFPEFLSKLDAQGFLDEIVGRKPSRRELARWEATLSQFEGFRQSGRFLDLGCAKGRFLQYVQERGWKALGVETVPALGDYCRTQLGLEVVTGDLMSAQFPDDHFDALHMSEVIEHVIDPVALLTEVHRVLRPGGLAIFTTGNVQSWSARLRGADWPYYLFNAGGHIRFYGPKSTRALGHAAGFERVSTNTRGFAFREGAELNGHWYKLPLKLIQGPLSTLAGSLGAGHRLTMRFQKNA